MFANKPLDREAIFWEHEGNKAARVGDWKLVGKHGGPWELYDLSKDRTESTDRAATVADRVKAMTTTYDAWAKRVNVEPWPVYSPKK